MAYLTINKNGQENISNSKPYREGLVEIDEETYCATENEDGDIEAVCFVQGKGLEYIPCDRSNLSYWNSDEGEMVTLPSGSIEKLIGRKMTFEDEPYCI